MLVQSFEAKGFFSSYTVISSSGSSGGYPGGIGLIAVTTVSAAMMLLSLPLLFPLPLLLLLLIFCVMSIVALLFMSRTLDTHIYSSQSFCEVSTVTLIL